MKYFILVALLLILIIILSIAMLYTCRNIDYYTKRKKIIGEYIIDKDMNEEHKKTMENIKLELAKIKNKLIFYWSFVLIVFLAILIIPGSIHQINTGEVAVVKVWGKAKETKTPGTHFDFWLGKNYISYDTKVREIDSKTMAYSQDAQTMEVELNIQYRIQIDKVLNIYEEYGQLEMLESRIKSVCDEKVKTVMSAKQAMRIIETRDTLSSDVIAVVSEATKKYYIEIVNVVITNIDFSDAFEQAVENKMIAEQQQLQEEYNKQKAITQAEAELEVAKRKAQAKIEEARAEAESIELKAEAEAQALAILQETWNAIPEEIRNIILQEKAISQWNGELPETLVGDDFLKQLLGLIN